jgi:hypothetical protein
MFGDELAAETALGNDCWSEPAGVADCVIRCALVAACGITIIVVACAAGEFADAPRGDAGLSCSCGSNDCACSDDAGAGDGRPAGWLVADVPFAGPSFATAARYSSDGIAVKSSDDSAVAATGVEVAPGL